MTDVDAGRPRPRIGLGYRLFYGSGSLAFGAKDNGLQTFLLLFYSQALQLPPAWVSATIAIVMVVDAFIDPIIGQTSDNLRSSWGRRHPFMYAAAIPVALTYMALWNPPHLPPVLLTLYMAAILIVCRTFISCYEIPSSAMVAELTDDYHTRTTLLSIRYVFAWAGGLGMYLLAYRVFLVNPDHTVNVLNVAGYGHYGMTAAVLMVVSIFVSAMGTHRLIPWLRKPPEERRNVVQLFGDMISTLQHRSFLMMLGVGLFSAMGQGLGFTLNAYILNFFWRLSSGQIQFLILQTVISSILSTFVAAIVSRRIGKKYAAICLMSLSVLIGALPMTLRLLGLFPENGSPMLVPAIFTFGCVSGPMGIAASILISSMIADVVEDSELKTGKRSEGLFFSASAFVSKAVSGAGILSAGLILSLIHFPVGARPDQVDASVLHNLALLYIPSTIGLYAIAVTFMCFYGISKATHEENLRKLAEDEVASAEAIGERGASVPRS